MTTITASSYSSNATSQPLAPLKPGQVQLLKQGGQFDISKKVKTIVQSHLGYLGTDDFSARFTKQQITFTLKNGLAAESRTLTLQNGHWMLSQNDAPASAINPALENEVNTLVTEILSIIEQASQAPVPNPTPATELTASVEGTDRTVDTELTEVKARLASLETQLCGNRTLEESLRTQKEISREIASLNEDLARRPQNDTAELKRALEEKDRQFQELQHRAEETIARLKAGAEADRQQFHRQQQIAEQEAREKITEKAAQLEHTKAELANSQDRSVKEKEELREQIAKLQGDLDRNRNHLEALVKQQSDAQADQKRQSSALDELNNKLGTAQKDCQNQQQEIARLEAELKQMKAELEEENAAHEKLQKDASLESTAMKDEVLFTKDKLKKAQKGIDELNSKKATLEAQLRELADSQAKSEQEKAALQAQIRKMQGDARIELHNRMEATLKQHKAAFDTMVAGLKQSASLNETKKQLGQAQIELRKQQENIGELEAALKDHKEALNIGLKGFKVALARKAEIREEAARTIKSLETKIQKLNSEVFAKEEELLTAQKKITTEQQTYQEQMGKMEELLKNREADLENVRAELEEESVCSERVKENYDYELQQLKDEVLSKKDSINNVQKEITDLKSEKSALQAQLDAVQTDEEDRNKMAAAQLTQLQKEYAELVEEHEIALDLYNLLDKQHTELSEKLKIADEEAAALEENLSSQAQVSLQEASDGLEESQLDQQQPDKIEPQSDASIPPLSIPRSTPQVKHGNVATVTNSDILKQIQILGSQVARVKDGLILRKDKDGALENYIFLLFIQEKRKKNEPVLLEKFNLSDLSPQDKILLEQLAQKAQRNLDPNCMTPYDLQKLFNSKEQNINTKIKIIQSLQKELGQTDAGMAQLEGEILVIFRPFFHSLSFNAKPLFEKKNYGDFFFANAPFLAADLQLAKELYEECITYYEKTWGLNAPQWVEEKISQMEETQRLLEEVERLFFVLLENCHVTHQETTAPLEATMTKNKQAPLPAKELKSTVALYDEELLEAMGATEKARAKADRELAQQYQRLLNAKETTAPLEAKMTENKQAPLPAKELKSTEKARAKAERELAHQYQLLLNPNKPRVEDL
ncbi:MAG TPA: hypothetical protein VHK67_00935 [Rhabdochlamydiaceae bacterium]|nr:hypothetical protein [Rhabdochlamydiaceae bacterium]